LILIKEIKMPFLKAIGFLLLLITGNVGYAGIPLPVDEKIDENHITYQVSEDVQELFQSTLTAPSVINHSPLVFADIPGFVFSSSKRENEAVRYVIFSRSIIPGLTVIKIIFPFHTFL